MKKQAFFLAVGLALGAGLVEGQQSASDQKQQIDAAVPRKAPVRPKKARRMLVTSLCVRDGKPVRGHPSIAVGNYALEQLGKRTGAYEAVFSNDVGMFRPDKIRQFDAICFNNTQGVLFEDAELKKSLLGFVSGGGGFVGFHAACVSFVQYPKYDFWPEFGRMLGGTENGGHPWMPNDSFFLKVDDPKSPLTRAFRGRGLEITEEVFQFQEPDLRQRLRVLVSIDMDKSKPTRSVLPVRQKDLDFPMSWIHAEGKGRVFYSALGHNAQIFSNAVLLEHFLAGIQYALGDLKADATPSAKLAAKGKKAAR
jgi:hypothetical protein